MGCGLLLDEVTASFNDPSPDAYALGDGLLARAPSGATRALYWLARPYVTPYGCIGITAATLALSRLRAPATFPRH